eukprot:s1513_g21.t4
MPVLLPQSAAQQALPAADEPPSPPSPARSMPKLQSTRSMRSARSGHSRGSGDSAIRGVVASDASDEIHSQARLQIVISQIDDFDDIAREPSLHAPAARASGSIPVRPASVRTDTDPSAPPDFESETDKAISIGSPSPSPAKAKLNPCFGLLWAPCWQDGRWRKCCLVTSVLAWIVVIALGLSLALLWPRDPTWRLTSLQMDVDALMSLVTAASGGPSVIDTATAATVPDQVFRAEVEVNNPNLIGAETESGEIHLVFEGRRMGAGITGPLMLPPQSAATVVAEGTLQVDEELLHAMARELANESPTLTFQLRAESDFQSVLGLELHYEMLCTVDFSIPDLMMADTRARAAGNATGTKTTLVCIACCGCFLQAELSYALKFELFFQPATAANARLDSERMSEDVRAAVGKMSRVLRIAKDRANTQFGKVRERAKRFSLSGSQAAASASQSGAPSDEALPADLDKVRQLTDLGFSEVAARHALRACAGRLDLAGPWLLDEGNADEVLAAEAGSHGSVPQKYESPALAVGGRARVSGLQNAAALNGTDVLLQKWDEASRRWIVSMPDGTVKSIRPQNLDPLYASQFTARAPDAADHCDADGERSYLDREELKTLARTMLESTAEPGGQASATDEVLEALSESDLLELIDGLSRDHLRTGDPSCTQENPEAPEMRTAVRPADTARKLVELEQEEARLKSLAEAQAKKAEEIEAREAALRQAESELERKRCERSEQPEAALPMREHIESVSANFDSQLSSVGQHVG